MQPNLSAVEFVSRIDRAVFLGHVGVGGRTIDLETGATPLELTYIPEPDSRGLLLFGFWLLLKRKRASKGG